MACYTGNLVSIRTCQVHFRPSILLNIGVLHILSHGQQQVGSMLWSFHIQPWEVLEDLSIFHLQSILHMFLLEELCVHK
jgi:hypothetical protein